MTEPGDYAAFHINITFFFLFFPQQVDLEKFLNKLRAHNSVH